MKRLHFILICLTVAAMDKAPEHLPLSCAKPAGRPRASEVEARHQNLIDTAGRLFLTLGYGNVSLEMIAREAHVAVRTIYVKFGGKAGLLKAALDNNRQKFFPMNDLRGDPRHFKDVILDFALHFLDLMDAPQAVAMQRMVIAEANTSPELVQSFFDNGPRLTREMIASIFERADFRADMRAGVDVGMLPLFLTNCIIGDQFARVLFGPVNHSREEKQRQLEQRLDLFYHAVLQPQ